MEIALIVILLLFYVQSVAKFVAWRLVPYERRMKGIRSHYAKGLRTVRLYDHITLLLVVAMVALLYATGADDLSFFTGLLAGMLLIQVFFHRFHEPIPEDRQPPKPTRPIQLVSYAIQYRPWAAWREMLLIGALSVWAVYTLVAGGLPA